MPNVFLSDAALHDLGRLEEFLGTTQDPLADGLLEFVMDALGVLTHQPGVGRPMGGGLRELIITRRQSGYLAKYEFDIPADIVRVVRIRHQRESGYTEEEV